MKDANQESFRQQRAGVALLIDGENVPARIAASVLAEASRWGEVVVRRIYGDWASPHMHAWRAKVTEHGMRACHQHLPKKNAADIALTVDAVNLFYQGIRCFCLCSGDSDYVPLVLWLKEQCCVVVVIGQRHAPLALQRSCSTFVPSDALPPTEESDTAMQESSASSLEQKPPKRHPRSRRGGEKRRDRLPSPRHGSNGGSPL